MAQKVVEWPGAFKIYEVAYNQVMKNSAPAWFFVFVITAATAISLILQGFSSTADKGYVDYAGALVLLFLVPLINYAFALVAGKRVTIADFMQFSFKKLLLVIVLSLMVGLIVLGSLLLLIIPAVWTIAWFAQSVYVLVDKDLGPVEALKESKRISKDHKSKIWEFIGVSMIFGIIAGILSIAPYVGAFFTGFMTVVSTVAATNVYMWLKLAAK